MHIVTTKFPAYATRLGSGAESMVVCKGLMFTAVQVLKI